MNAQKYYQAILAGCVAVLAIGAGAQTSSTSTAPPATSATAPPDSTTAPAANSGDATNQQQSAQGAAPAKKATKTAKTTAKTAKTTHHAKKQNVTHATQRNQPPVSSQESQYRTALRQCVEGQASRRDQCLDDAIARYGRS